MYISTPYGSIQLSVCANTADGELFSNVAVNGNRGLPTVIKGKVPAVICGGGPSLMDTLEKIAEYDKAGATIYALNNAARVLAEHGIRVHGQIVLDAREANVDFIKDSPADILYLASQCHPLLFEEATKPVMLWHPVIDGIEKHAQARCQIGGGTTVGLSGLCLVYTLGHREIHLFGYDSSYRGDESHAYKQEMNKDQDKLRIAVNNRVFFASLAMATQANKFPELARELASMGCSVHIHGDGLLQHIIRTESEQAARKVMSTIYDLGSSPPSFDFLTFISQAEKHRVENGFDCMDVYFQPGPIAGFRDDELPPDPQEREAMLWRICVSLTRCLPSVRNVKVLREREEVAADFPVGWSNESPLRHYASDYFRESKPILEATEAGKRVAQKIADGKPYVTITMRQAGYHTWRNSDDATWVSVAEYFEGLGYKVIFIPDTNGHSVDGREMCWQAAFDIDVRLALYQGAHFNTGLMGGPMTMLILQKAPFVMFVPYHEGGYKERVTFGAYAVKDHEETYANGVVVWGGDQKDFVIGRLLQYLGERKVANG